MWALWICYEGVPPANILWIFAVAVFVMRSAGCVINDYADRDIDGSVERTKERPLASGALSAKQALGLFVLLGLIAIALLLQLPPRVWPWAVPAAALTIIYPYMKRFIQAPQLVLGLSFSFAIPMVYVTAGQTFDAVFYCLFVANLCWVVAYDTAYAMSDREDDLKIGVKSSAIWFGRFDVLAVLGLHVVSLCLWIAIALNLGLSAWFTPAWIVAALMITYQGRLIAGRDRQACFKAFLNNAWVGGILWFGLLASY